MSQGVLVLYGPTGVGKTRLAIELCKRFGGEIVGADSVQIYRGFDIGSGKPSAAELDGIPHHLIDVLDATESIDAARFALLADTAVADIAQRGRVPVVVGGTGLWLRAWLRGLVSLPAKDPALRAQLEADFTRAPAMSVARLREVDPISAARIHPNDMTRIVRALEVHAQTGQALGALRDQHAHGSPRHRALVIAVDLPEPHYSSAIEQRARHMIARGLMAEVASLMERYGRDSRPLHSVGYKQALSHVVDGAPLEQTIQRIVQATRLYARRQRTWGRTDPDIALRLAPSAVLTEAPLDRIRAHLGVRAD
jgi:tRNA dimethylallyltransferase